MKRELATKEDHLEQLIGNYEEEDELTDDDKDHHHDGENPPPLFNHQAEENTVRRWRFESVRPEHFSFSSNRQLVLFYQYQTEKNSNRSKVLTFESLSAKKKLQIYHNLLLVQKDAFDPEVATYLQNYFAKNTIVLPKEILKKPKKPPLNRPSVPVSIAPISNSQMPAPIELKRPAAIASNILSSTSSQLKHSQPFKTIKLDQINRETQSPSTVTKSSSSVSNNVEEPMDEEAVIEARVRMKLLYKQAHRTISDLVDQAKILYNRGQNALAPEEIARLRLYDVNHACLNLAAELSGLSTTDYWPLSE